MGNSLFEVLAEVLKQDDRFVSHEGDLLKNTIRDKAESLDENLISLLLDNELLRAKFFVSIKDVIVFDAHKFIKLINNKEFLPDSFTSFKNKIGLTNKQGDFIASSNEVVLSFPFKDCVLAGGQDKEDSKRDEVFYNEILGSDDIDRLFDKKVFTSFKRIDKDGEHALKGFNRNEEGAITDNLIIKGNNLLALHSLKSNFVGKVKLIYIDPPYNTGSDGFKYNDKFNHSTWLTFMKNRLEVAKELLRADGVIFVQTDGKEQGYLKVLMDEIFERENFIELITVVNNPRGRDYGGIANMHEFITVYKKSYLNEIYPVLDEEKEFPFADDISGFETRELRNRNTKFNDKNRPNLCYPFYLDPDTTDVNGFHPISLTKKDGYVEVFPAISEGIQTVWRWGREKANSELNINICGKSMKEKGRYQIIEKYRKKTSMVRSVWWDKEVNSERGTLHLKELFNGKVFDNPKPEETMARIIEIATLEGDIVLDYHLGSGTTCAVAHKMGRQYIGIEQMDYIETVSVERMKKVIEGEQGGISKNVEWKGGGEFVCMEIMQANQKILNQINQASNISDLLNIYEQIKESEFINYSVDTGSLNVSNLDENDFDALKAFLIEILDKNLLYVNYSERNDRNSGVSEDDKKVNEEFYQ